MSDIPAHGSLNLSFGEICDRGKVREENQDNVRNASIPLGELFIVADGIGGYQGGATASRMVVDGFYTNLASRPAGYPAPNALMEACTATNAAIYDRANSGDPSLQRMGSTVVMALIQPGANSGTEAFIGHVGDSRAYLIHHGQMHKITNDHSAVQALLNKNLITEEEARNHPDASVLTRSLGHRPEVEIEIDHVLLQPGDSLLLCSDGLWGYVHDADIATVATDPSLSPQTAARLLLDQALAAGGPDNIGIEFIQVDGAAAPVKAVAPRQAAFANVPTPPGGPPAVMRRNAPSNARKLELIAVVLLIVAGCGYLLFASRSQTWPFHAPKQPEIKNPDKTVTVTPTQNESTKQESSHSKQPIKPADRHPDNGHANSNQPVAPPNSGSGTQHDDDHAGQPTGQSTNSNGGNRPENRPTVPPQPQPAQNQPGQNQGTSNQPTPNQPHGIRRNVVIVGDPERPGAHERDDFNSPILSIRHEHRPACMALSKDRPIIYHHKSESSDAILQQNPILKGHIGEHDKPLESGELTPDISNACGEEFDVVIILARKPGQNTQAGPGN